LAAELLTKRAGLARSVSEVAFSKFKLRLVELATQRGFSRDAIGAAFAEAAADAKMCRWHDEAIKDDAGNVDSYRQQELHKQCGRAIKAAFDAEVDGRSAPLDGSTFIKSYTFLRKK
jgi:hypothetical protein